MRADNNIKVYFAGMENFVNATVAQCADVRYGLYTIYPFIAPNFGIKASPLYFKPKQQEIDYANAIPKYFKRCILDSGVFSLIYGAGRQYSHDKKLMADWYDAYVSYIIDHNINAIIVEYDSQSVLGVDKAWEYRLRLKRDLSNHTIINVAHMIDGQYGFEKLLEFTDYLAIPVSEWRVKRRCTYIDDVQRLCYYAKTKKPNIGIHLLGCTERYLTRICRFCTSCDSTSWLNMIRFGHLEKRRRSECSKKALNEAMRATANAHEYFINTKSSHLFMAETYLSMRYHKSRYETWYGDQS